MAPFQDVPCTIKQGSALLNMMGSEEALSECSNWERGCSGKCCDCNHVFFVFPVVYPLQKNDLLTKNKCCITDLNFFLASLCKRDIFKSYSINTCDFISLPSLPLCYPPLAGILVLLSRMLGRMAESHLTCRRTCFHWITQCSSLQWLFFPSLCSESHTAEATTPPQLLNHCTAFGMLKAGLIICKYDPFFLWLLSLTADLVKCIFNVACWLGCPPPSGSEAQLVLLSDFTNPLPDELTFL